jgi:hypothetical protein
MRSLKRAPQNNLQIYRSCALWMRALI